MKHLRFWNTFFLTCNPLKTICLSTNFGHESCSLLPTLKWVISLQRRDTLMDFLRTSSILDLSIRYSLISTASSRRCNHYVQNHPEIDKRNCNMTKWMPLMRLLVGTQ